MKLSVIITTYDQHELTKQHVLYCMKSQRVPDEVIVVNDGGDKELINLLKTVDKKTKLLYARINEDIPWNQVGARNLGVFLSSGDMLAMEDNDHLPSESFYQEAVQIMEDKNIDIVLSKDRHSVLLEDIINNKIEIKGWRGSHKFVGLIRKTSYVKLKGFDERFAGHYGWDVTDWIRRQRRLGMITSQIGSYYMVQDGMTKTVNRNTYVDSEVFRMDNANRKVLKDNDNKLRSQHPNGLLNFTYTIEEL